MTPALLDSAKPSHKSAIIGFRYQLASDVPCFNIIDRSQDDSVDNFSRLVERVSSQEL